jgi:general secretion pathway protein D
MKKLLLSFFLLSFASSAYSQTIEEKKALIYQYNNDFNDEAEDELNEINSALHEKQAELQGLYKEASSLYDSGASEELFHEIREKVKKLKNEIQHHKTLWKKQASKLTQEESYSLWNHPETTLSQLIMDYGSSDYIYIVPPDIGEISLHINSALPLPRESWDEMLSIILSAHGVSIRQENAFIRVLFIGKDVKDGIKNITTKREDILLFPPAERACFLLFPEAFTTKEDYDLLSRFSDENNVSIHNISHALALVAKPEALTELLKIYDFIKTHQDAKEYKILSLHSIEPSEMEKILLSVFHGKTVDAGSEEKQAGSSFTVIPLHKTRNALFLLGNKNDIKRAEEVVASLENHVSEDKGKSLFLYTCKHSNPKELAEVLEKIYHLIETGSLTFQDTPDSSEAPQGSSTKKESSSKNFIVDLKTNSLIMVVEKYNVEKLKALLKKIDIPKKMIRIEVLLVEKRIRDSSHIGLNLLNIGSAAQNIRKTGLQWNNTDATDTSEGILSFFLSRKKRGTHVPAYDFAYRFLLSQDDIHINANPSVTTVNQTPAKIDILEEISLSTGTVVERDANSTSVLKDSYKRAEYGITIEVTPTVHYRDDTVQNEDTEYITLKTDIQFDSTSPSTNNRPDVTKRHINNEVRIADGQTVIIGGLRRKNFSDEKKKVPFLGELPGLGKLFGITETSDSKTEMFIFLTPKIITDPSYDFEVIKNEEMKKRPGDTPEFMHAMEYARAKEREKLFHASFKMLFGPKNTTKKPPQGY